MGSEQHPCPECGGERPVLKVVLGVEMRRFTCGGERCVAAYDARVQAAKDAERLKWATEHNPDAWMRQAGVPECFMAAKIEDFLKDPTPAGPANLFMYGPTGTGKSHLAAAFLRKIAEQVKRSARWTRPGPLARAVFAGEGDDRANREARVLILDDLGSDRMDAHHSGLIYEIVATREERGLATVATSNMSPEELAGWDARVWSRLQGFKAIKMGGADRRDKRRRVAVAERKDIEG